MRFEPKPGLDAIDCELLDLVQNNARLTFAELGRRLGLSPPAAAERLKRLEDRGIIRAYRAEVDLAALGRAVHVIVRVTVQPKDYPRFKKSIAAMDEIFECHHVTGAESFVLRAGLHSVGALEPLIQKLSAYGPTATSVILSTALDRRHFRPVQQL
jgi:Lrp/AsnC family leucine-responsive transcriptional regulator